MDNTESGVLIGLRQQLVNTADDLERVGGEAWAEAADLIRLHASSSSIARVLEVSDIVTKMVKRAAAKTQERPGC